MTTTDTTTTANQEPVKRKRTGRPRKSNKRSTFLMVRMTPTERLLIEERSKRAGIKPSDWFRRSAKSAKLFPRFTAEETGWFPDALRAGQQPEPADETGPQQRPVFACE